MDYIVAYLEGVQFVYCQPLAPLHLAADADLVVAFEYLVVGIEALFSLFVHISLVQRDGDEIGTHSGAYVPEDLLQAAGL